MTHNDMIKRMRIILPTLMVVTLLLSVDSCSSLLQEKETVSTQQNSILNYFCLVVITGNAGDWYRDLLLMYLATEMFNYCLHVYDFPLLCTILLECYITFNQWMPLKLYNSRTLFCQGFDPITTYGLKGIRTREEGDGYVILVGFTGLWAQKENSDFAIGFAACVIDHHWTG